MMTLQIRPARPDDREAVAAISAQIWEGHDYLPRHWEEWLHDPTGPLLVVVLNSQPVAVGKISLQSPTEAWLAGARVDPAHRRKGIATAMLEYSLDWLKERGIRWVRLTTASDNTPIHHMAARFGFERIASMRRFVAPLERCRSSQQVRTVGLVEEQRAWESLRQSSFLQVTGGLFGVGWTWQRFTQERLREHLQRNEVLAWEDDAAALAIVAYRPPKRLRRIAMLVGDREAGLAMVQALRCDPQLIVEDPEKPPQLRLTVPEGVPDLAWIAERAELRPRWDRAMWLFARDLRETPPHE